MATGEDDNDINGNGTTGNKVDDGGDGATATTTTTTTMAKTTTTETAIVRWAGVERRRHALVSP